MYNMPVSPEVVVLLGSSLYPLTRRPSLHKRDVNVQHKHVTLMAPAHTRQRRVDQGQRGEAPGRSLRPDEGHCTGQLHHRLVTSAVHHLFGRLAPPVSSG